MYVLELYQLLPGIGWTGVTSVELGTVRHSALTSPVLESFVEAETLRSPWRSYYTIKHQPQ